MEDTTLKIQNPNQPTVKQHFVPKFYLNNFVNDDNKVEILDCKNRRILSPKSTSAICYSKYFYAVETGTHDEISQYIEDAFQQMEDNISTKIQYLIDTLGGTSKVEDDDKWLVSLLMSMLWLRNPKLREQINVMNESMYKQMNEMIFHTPYKDKFFDNFDKDTGNKTSQAFREEFIEMMKSGNYDLKFNNAAHLQLLNTIPNFANLLWGQNWRVYINNTETPFLTSDNPLVETNPDEPKSFWGFDFMSRIHYFSLSPRICIVATRPIKGSVKTIKRKTLYQYKDSDKNTVLFLNLKISGHSNGFAYSKSINSFNEILKYLTNKKSLKNI